MDNKSRFYATSIFGSDKSGYLTGVAARFAQSMVDEGGQIALQGPEWSNRTSSTVTVLYRRPGAKIRSGWYVWGKAVLIEDTAKQRG